MFLTISGTVASEFKVDLDKLANYVNDVVDVDTLHSAIVVDVARWALSEGISVSDTYPLYIYDAEIWEGEPADKQIDAGPDSETWMREVAELTWFVYHAKTYLDRDQVFAWLNKQHWKYVNFDNLEDDIAENYSQEFNGDHEDFAKEWMSNYCDESIPDHLEEFFDYQAYGERLISEMIEYEWNGTTYLYHQ